MKTGIVLIRHGETKWNKEEIFRGRTDIPLNKNGLAQAKATSDYLLKKKFAAIYSSPLSRARQTAEALCKNRNIKPQLRDAFIDLSFGPWEGKTISELTENYPEQIRIWQEQPHLLNLPDAETLAQARQRAYMELESLAEANQDNYIAIVSHRVILKLLLLAMLNLGNDAFWKIKQNTCCINLLEYSREKGFVIAKVNDTCHLQ